MVTDELEGFLAPGGLTAKACDMGLEVLAYIKSASIGAWEDFLWQ